MPWTSPRYRTRDEFAIHDLPAIARGFGCDGVRVESRRAARGVLAEALDAPGPTVIELRTPAG